MKKDSVAVSKEIIMFDVASMACQQSKKKCCFKEGFDDTPCHREGELRNL
jgi:hypothetical protein